MDITNFTFSEDEESLQSQTLKDNIQQISRHLLLNSTPSPSNIMATVCPSNSPNPSSAQRPTEQVLPATPTADFPWNTPFIFVPAVYSPHTPPSLFPCRSEIKTPVFTPPTGFRDTSNNNLEDSVNDPVDLSSGGALDLRLPSVELRKQSENDQEKPLIIVIPEDGGSSTSYVSTQTDESYFLKTKSNLKTSSTCTSLDKTIFYPNPDTAHISKEEYIPEISNNITSLRDIRNLNKNQHNMTNNHESCNQKLSGLDTIRQFYTQSADDTGDKTSTTVLIDNAFQYLKDIPDEISQVAEDLQDHPCQVNIESEKPTCRRDLNETYDVVFTPVLARKPPSGLSQKRNSGIVNPISSDAKQDKKEPDTCNPQQTKVDSDPREESFNGVSFSDSSSFTRVTSMGSDASTSTWSVKQAVTSLASNLTLTLTKTQPISTSSFTGDSPQNSRRHSKSPEKNLSSTPKNRIVLGSNYTIEESTIVKEASQVRPSNQQLTVLSYPDTPDVSLCSSNHSTNNSDCVNSNKAPENVMSSTTREMIKQPIGDELTPPAKSKEESLRTKLMKKSVSAKPLSPDSDSVLNMAFRQENKRSTPVKRKKRSLLKSIKKQFLCNNQQNASQLSQLDHTVTGTCLGRIINPQQSRKKKSCSPKLFPRCTQTPNSSSATISFLTLDRSSYSSPLPDWCKQILSTTETTSTPKPISAPVQYSEGSNTQFKKSTGVSTSSLNHSNCDTTAQYLQGPKFFDSVGISWLSQIDSYHSPTKSMSKSVSTTTRQSPQLLPSSPSNSNSKYEMGDNRHMVKQVETSRSIVSSQLEPGTALRRLEKSSPLIMSPDKKSPSKAASPSAPQQISSRPRTSSPSLPRTVSSNSSAVTFDTQQVKHVKHWMALSPCNSQIDLIDQVGRRTAEWLTTFIMDKSMKSIQNYFMVQPTRNVLFELCHLCEVRVKASTADNRLLVLTKTSTSRAPTETDLKRLIRGTRR